MGRTLIFNGGVIKFYWAVVDPMMMAVVHVQKQNELGRIWVYASRIFISTPFSFSKFLASDDDHNEFSILFQSKKQSIVFFSVPKRF